MFNVNIKCRRECAGKMIEIFKGIVTRYPSLILKYILKLLGIFIKQNLIPNLIKVLVAEENQIPWLY